MLGAGQAVRMGMRAAMRNPELALGKALVDATGSALALLPVALVAVLAFATATARDPVIALLDAGSVVFAAGWSTVGGVVTAAILSWTLAMAFWSGALPLLAADAELGRRPDEGNFWRLVSAGFPRVVAAGAIAHGVSTLFALAMAAGLYSALISLAVRPAPIRMAGVALLAASALVGSFLLDLLARLMLVGSAAFGDGASGAFGRAVRILGRRLGACCVVALAFGLVELVVGGVSGTLTAALTTAGFGVGAQLLALPARIAVWLAFAAVFAWLEVGRQGALAAIAADEEGLIEPSAPAQPPPPEPVIEALPADEPVIEALPVTDE
jgi:hypothetical protein